MAPTSTPTTWSSATPPSGTPHIRCTRVAAAPSSTSPACGAGSSTHRPPDRSHLDRHRKGRRRRRRPFTTLSGARRTGSPAVTKFILRRLLVTIPVLFGIVFLVFALARLVPGDPCRAVLGERATDEGCDAFIVRYGLDQPIPVQFARSLE